jgi:capsule polysaccharide export protein KpsE/RkpR
VKQPVHQIANLSFLRSRSVQRRIAVGTLGMAVVGALYGTFAPKWYRSMVTVVPATPQKTTGLASMMMGSELGGLAAGLGGASVDGPRIVAVLQSAAVTDAVVEKFDLMKRYGARYPESAREELWDHCDVKALSKANLVQLSCEDRDPRFAQQVLAYFAQVGNEAFRRVSVGSASEEVRFGERRVAELRKQADEAAVRMREFQEAHQIVDLESQARAVVSAMAMLHSQRIAKKTELGYARTYSTSDEAASRQLESQLSVVDDRLRELEAPGIPESHGAKGTSARNKASGLFPAAAAVPKIRAEFEQLYRDRKVAESTLVFALDRLEGARSNEARDVSTFQVLDPPTVSSRPSRPRRAEVTFVGALFGFAAAVAWEWRRARRQVD